MSRPRGNIAAGRGRSPRGVRLRMQLVQTTGAIQGVDTPARSAYSDGMSTIQRAYRVVGEAEGQIQRLIGKAAEEADYDVLARLAELARGLREMRPEDIPIPVVPATASASAERTKRQSSEVGTQRKVHPEKTRVRAKYPRFSRDGENLVKVGWSKANQSEYQHRAPWAVLANLVSRLEARPRMKNSLFTMDEILPLEIGEGTVAPDYQPYLCLAWLRSTGVVTKRGREGYRVLADLSMSTVNTLWEGLLQEGEGDSSDD
jgi:hypothetical protein